MDSSEMRQMVYSLHVDESYIKTIKTLVREKQHLVRALKLHFSSDGHKLLQK